jgi:hypothetical protein
MSKALIAFDMLASLGRDSAAAKTTSRDKFRSAELGHPIFLPLLKRTVSQAKRPPRGGL